MKETFFSLISMPAYFNIHIYAFRALLSVDYPSLFCAFSAVFSNVQGHYHARLDHEPDHDGTITDNGRIQLILFLARSLSIGVHDRLSVGFFSYLNSPKFRNRLIAESYRTVFCFNVIYNSVIFNVINRILSKLPSSLNE